LQASIHLKSCFRHNILFTSRWYIILCVKTLSETRFVLRLSENKENHPEKISGDLDMEAVWGAVLSFLFILATLAGYGTSIPSTDNKDKSEQVRREFVQGQGAEGKGSEGQIRTKGQVRAKREVAGKRREKEGGDVHQLSRSLAPSAMSSSSVRRRGGARTMTHDAPLSRALAVAT
jgi:hypothetical protein